MDCLSPKNPISKIYFIRKTTPTRHAGSYAVMHTAFPPAMVFHFLSPGVGRNMQDRLAGCLIPYSTLSRCNIPRTPLRLPCSPAEVSLSSGFSGQPATAAPCRGCRSYFSFSCYGSLFNLHQSPATHLSAGKYFPAKLSLHHLHKCPGYFVPLHTDILFRQIKTAKTFIVKVHSLPRGIYLHSIILSFIL